MSQDYVKTGDYSVNDRLWRVRRKPGLLGGLLASTALPNGAEVTYESRASSWTGNVSKLRIDGTVVDIPYIESRRPNWLDDSNPAMDTPHRRELRVLMSKIDEMVTLRDEAFRALMCGVFAGQHETSEARFAARKDETHRRDVQALESLRKLG